VGSPEFAGLPGVLAVNLLRSAHGVVDLRLGTDEQICHVIGGVDQLDDLLTIRRQADEMISLTYE
jgi:hypothetical protein